MSNNYTDEELRDRIIKLMLTNAPNKDWTIGYREACGDILKLLEHNE